MKAEIRSILSAEIENVWTYSPDPTKPFCFTVNLLLSLPGEEFVEWFYVTVLNSLAIAEMCEGGSYYRAYASVVMERFEFDVFERFVTEFISRCEGDTWEEIARQISQLASWEMESQFVDRQYSN